MEFDINLTPEELTVFTNETSEHIQQINLDVELLGRSNNDNDLLREIFRLVHTIKGSSAMIGYHEMSGLSHSIESFLEKIHDNTVPLNLETRSVLSDCAYYLQILLDRMNSYDEFGPNIESFTSLLEQYTDQSAGEFSADNREYALQSPSMAYNNSYSRSTPARDTESFSAIFDELTIDRTKISQLTQMLQYKFPHDELISELIGTSQHVFEALGNLEKQLTREDMVPVSSMFSHLPAMIRNFARSQGKLVDFSIEGADIKIDKTGIKQIKESLVHLLRNAVDHGIESPEERINSGKPEIGIIRLRVTSADHVVNFLVEDDGRGIEAKRIKESAVSKWLISGEKANTLSEKDIINLIFLPGMSTIEKASEMSGRGIGMDIVRTNVEAIEGRISISTRQSKGTRITLVIPQIMTPVKGYHVVSKGQHFVIPAKPVVEIIPVAMENISIKNKKSYLEWQGNLIPLVTLIQTATTDEKRSQKTVGSFAVIIKDDHLIAGIAVDEVRSPGEISARPAGIPAELNNTLSVRLDGGQYGLVPDISHLLSQSMISVTGDSSPVTNGKKKTVASNA